MLSRDRVAELLTLRQLSIRELQKITPIRCLCRNIGECFKHEKPLLKHLARHSIMATL